MALKWAHDMKALNKGNFKHMNIGAIQDVRFVFGLAFFVVLVFGLYLCLMSM